MAERSKHWLITVMAIEEVPGFDPNNIYFCVKTVGPRGKGRIAKRLGITHMVDDRLDALKSLCDISKNFPQRGQLILLSPTSKDEYPEDWFIPVNSWLEVMARINVSNHILNSVETMSHHGPIGLLRLSFRQSDLNLKSQQCLF